MSKRPHLFKLNDSHSVAAIHQAIQASSSIQEAAAQLKLGDWITLATHLSKFILDGELLTFASFKKITVERAEEIWGEGYQQPMLANDISINSYSPVYLHSVARDCKTIRKAAIILGVRDYTFDRFLARHHLNFKDFRELSREAFIEIFGDVLELEVKEQRVNLTPAVPLKTLDNDILDRELAINHSDRAELDFNNLGNKRRGIDSLVDLTSTKRITPSRAAVQENVDWDSLFVCDSLDEFDNLYSTAGSSLTPIARSSKVYSFFGSPITLKQLSSEEESLNLTKCSSL
ncbi:hypothetical protein [Legionella sp. km772]|uniref:hypothetical protein n=1 Tax=Legionella sp. km772 TaxID=2498111 RepID=UPI000F8E531F|nr:hypothetical protein [Legionella sp. km772]RUR06820.1 hypothetical protein ELY15_12850 [Legionella sp. km772]